ncbi:hypothetical protein D3C87_1587020 [compost metagenome]
MAFAAARIVADQHVAGLGAQARTRAVGAGLDIAVLAQFFAHRRRIRFAPAALQVRDDALEGMPLDRAAAFFVQVEKRNLFFAGPVQDFVAQGFG